MQSDHGKFLHFTPDIAMFASLAWSYMKLNCSVVIARSITHGCFARLLTSQHQHVLQAGIRGSTLTCKDTVQHFYPGHHHKSKPVRLAKGEVPARAHC